MMGNPVLGDQRLEADEWREATLVPAWRGRRFWRDPWVRPDAQRPWGYEGCFPDRYHAWCGYGVTSDRENQKREP
jgi:hypothetical protein